MASSGSKGNRQSPCLGYLVVFHALTPTRGFGVRPQALIFAFDTLANGFLTGSAARYQGQTGRCRHTSTLGNRQQVTSLQAWRIFSCIFFSRLFVDRNAMVVSLQREKVTGGFAVTPPYLQRQGTPAGEKTGNLLCRRTAAGGGEPPRVRIGRTSAGMKQSARRGLCTATTQKTELRTPVGV